MSKWREEISEILFKNGVYEKLFFDEIIKKENEFKNKKLDEYEKQIEAMKNCYNCKHGVWSLISDAIECCHPKKELRNTCEDKYTNWEIINNGQ